MADVIEYEKGGNKGKIMKSNGKYLAITAVKSKWFKTKGWAEVFMKQEGYEKVEDQ